EFWTFRPGYRGCGSAMEGLPERAALLSLQVRNPLRVLVSRARACHIRRMTQPLPYPESPGLVRA
ncbi:MAG: hypothetical protein Q8S58_19120, partial [Bosea sp. (in: a-proteobacteria)]|nr:hypothetical protein [Bosea sp. (in: a-proteobacteria)]